MIFILKIIIVTTSVAILMFLHKTLPSYAAKKGENRANAEDGRKIAYEDEKGRNLATKEDIDTIIKELEKVKAEVEGSTKYHIHSVNIHVKKVLPQ